MRSRPRVVVIIPLFNKVRTIGRALDSVFAQSFEDFEVVVVDDGSTDHGAEQVLAYSSSKVRLIRQTNQGPGAARNRGLRESQSEYVAFLDADDEWAPSFLATLVDHLDENPECAAAFSNSWLGPDMLPNEQFSDLVSGIFRMPTVLDRRTIVRDMNFMHSPTSLSRRQVVETLGGFYARDRCLYGEDLYLWLKLALNHPIYREATPLGWYHTEDSELAHGRRRHPQPWPMLTDPDDIRRHCPKEYHQFLEDLLAFYAIYLARRYFHARCYGKALKALLNRGTPD